MLYANLLTKTTTLYVLVLLECAKIYEAFIFIKHYKGERQQQHNPDPLQSTVELGYLDSSRICVDNRAQALGPELLCSICQNVLWKPLACAKPPPRIKRQWPSIVFQ
jgi:hypothetical protein